MRTLLLALVLLSLPVLAATPRVSAQAAKTLDQAASLLERDKFAEAVRLLSELSDGANASDHEQALALRLLAWSDLRQGRSNSAVGRYRTLLSLPDLPGDLYEEITRNLVYLHAEAGRHTQVIALLEQLPATRDDSRLLLTLARSQLARQQNRAALQSLRQAVALMQKAGQPPDESLLLQLRAVQHASKDWNGLITTLEQLLQRFPKRAYWLHLAATWQQLGKADRQIATLELALLHGDLQSTDITMLARLMLARGTPARAARLLDARMEDGMLPRNEDNLKLLYQARWQAREREAALRALTLAARAGQSGELYLQLARHRLQMQDWDAALAALNDAGNTQQAPDPAQLALLRGMALVQKKEPAAAREQLLQARRNPQTAAQARQWLDYLTSLDQ